MKSKKKRLTPKQKVFCQRYILHWNATQAALEAGYSKKTARQIASDNLSKAYIKDYVAEIQEDLEKQAGISRLMILMEQKKIAFSSIAYLHNSWIERKDFERLTDEQKDCIQQIETKVDVIRVVDMGEELENIKEVEFVKIKLYDKQKALDSIAKMLGYNAPEKIDLTTKGKKLASPTFNFKNLNGEK